MSASSISTHDNDGQQEKLVAVLGYHKIGRAPDEWGANWWYVPEECFAGQISALRADGWEAIDSDALVRGLDDPGALPPKPFLVTFDDAYLSLRHTVDQLDRLELPATVFVPTGYVGGSNTFDGGQEPPEEICDWQTLRELRRRGVSIQSHGISHRGFSELTVDEQRRELAESKRIIEDELGSAVDLFAYPYGDPGAASDVSDVVREAGYSAALTFPGGPCRVPVEDRFKVPRVAVGPDTDILRALRE